MQKQDQSQTSWLFKLHLYPSYTFKKFKKIYYSSVDNHPKLTEIGKNGFGATKAIVKQLFSFFCDWQVTFIWESHLKRKKLEKSLMTFLLLFNSLNFGKTSLFCCNGYSHASFKFFLWISSRITKKIIYKRKKWKKGKFNKKPVV